MNITKLEKLKQEVVTINEQLSIAINKFDFDKCKSFYDYEDYLEPYSSKLNELSRKIRMMEDYVLVEIPTYGHIMTLSDFIKDVKCGAFIDYDGSGNYVKDDKMTSITIYPSDVKHRSIRKEFDKIVWFNK